MVERRGYGDGRRKGQMWGGIYLLPFVQKYVSWYSSLTEQRDIMKLLLNGTEFRFFLIHHPMPLQRSVACCQENFLTEDTEDRRSEGIVLFPQRQQHAQPISAMLPSCPRLTYNDRKPDLDESGTAT